MAIVDQIPGFVAGLAVASVVWFFVARNNPEWISARYRELKAAFDDKEKMIRKELDELELEGKIKEAVARLKEKGLL